jgi:serine protease inhibitor
LVCLFSGVAVLPRTRAKFHRLTGATTTVVLAAALSGAAPLDYWAPPIPMLTAAGVARVAAPADAPVPAVTAAVSRLGYRMASLQPDRNWVASPLSAANAFAMLRAGADGQTAAEIDSSFAFPRTGLHEAFNELAARLSTVDVPRPRAGDEPTPRPVVAIGNGLFVQDGLPIGPAFLKTLAAQYGTGVHQVDFNTADAADVIGAWTRQQTAGKIRKVVGPGIPGVQFVLANTVYLRADWALPFDASAVTETFHAPHGPSAVPMMNTSGEVRYAAGRDGWAAVELPYQGGDLAMRVLLPAPGDDPDTMLRPEIMAGVADALRPAPVDVHLPRWKFTSAMQLEALGPGVLYGPGADLSGIHPGLYLGKAEQHVFVEVDERGTEAAAATSLVGMVSAHAPPDLVFRADRPFAFAIVHPPTGLPLFVGRVIDPAAATD